MAARGIWKDVEEWIQEMRDSYNFEGRCYLFALMFKHRFGGVIKSDQDHVIVYFMRMHWDINGEYKKDTSRHQEFYDLGDEWYKIYADTIIEDERKKNRD